MDQDWDHDYGVEPAKQVPHAERQEGTSEPEYLGSEQASGTSSGIEGAMATVTLFLGNIISPKFKMAYASCILSATLPDNAATSTPTYKGLVVVQTKSPPVLAA